MTIFHCMCNVMQFESLKGTLRELALVPSGGGGLLTHALAHFASAVKVSKLNIGRCHTHCLVD